MNILNTLQPIEPVTCRSIEEIVEKSTVNYYKAVPLWEWHERKDYLRESIRREMAFEFCEFMQKKLLLKLDSSYAFTRIELRASVIVFNEQEVKQILRKSEIRHTYIQELRREEMRISNKMLRRNKARKHKSLMQYLAGLRKAKELL